MKDRLIEILKQFTTEDCKITHQCGYCDYGELVVCASAVAEHLLANGVIVPPVKVGQTVYVVNRYYGGLWRIHECRVDNLTIYERLIFMSLIDGNYNFGIEISEIGKTVFLTREEAEKALAENKK